MDINKPTAVIGTNSWGNKAYGKVLRGISVDEATISEAVQEAIREQAINPDRSVLSDCWHRAMSVS